MLPVIWHVRETALPIVRRRCPHCRADAHTPTGTFRVNANGKLLDVWILATCRSCGRTAKLVVHERVRVTTLDRRRLDGYHRNDVDLVAAVLAEPGTARRNNYRLDWDGAWELVGEPPTSTCRVTVSPGRHAEVSPLDVLAAGLGLSRSRITRLVKVGGIVCSADLRRPTASPFTVEVAAEVVAEVVDALAAEQDDQFSPTT
ncbi:DUF1062 domain-containing protein [Actinopolymorpha sp. NPDC004070]|uniref:DUF1062 domain-containing protein n=1 Tax=Actinopolymorpha sp. NPDC004070 TaxID=3154548 RepID=UPI0033B505DB